MMNQQNLLKKYVFWPEIDNDFHKNIDFSKTSISEVSNVLASASPDKSSPLTNYIYQFYGYNEYLNNIRNKNDGFISINDTAIFNDYKVFLDDFSKKIFSYILYCSIGEASYSNYLAEYSNPVYSTIRKAFIAEQTNNIYSSEYLQFKEEMNGIKITKNAYKNWLLNHYYTYDRIPQKFKDDYLSAHPEIVSQITKKFTHHKDPKFDQFIRFMMDIKKISQAKGIFSDHGHLQNHLVKEKLLTKDSIGGLSTEDFLFYLGEFFLKGFNGGYGGQPWKDIVQHGLSFSKGDMNTEMFLDRSLSLEHNGGNMFNKNFIFSTSYNHFSFYWPYISEGKSSSNSMATPSVSMNFSNLLFNLQNSSSVFMVNEMPKLAAVSKMSEAEITNYIKNTLDLTNPIYKSLDLVQLANSIKNQAFNFHKAFTSLNKENASFLKKINTSNLYSKTFNLQNFLSSYYKTTESGYHEDLLISSTPLFSILPKMLYEDKKLTSKKSKSIQNTEDHVPVFNFYNLNSKKSAKLSKEKIGGKAKGLVDLIGTGFNVPKAMVFDTATCLSYIKNKKHFRKEFKNIAPFFKPYLTANDGSPLLASVRSGAPVSMPGMMDSILNVGIDDKTYPLLVEKYGVKMIHQCTRSFMGQFCSSKLGLDVKFPKNFDAALTKFKAVLIVNNIPVSKVKKFPLDTAAQVKLSIEAVFDSWHSPRAIAWRNEKGIDHTMGTAATVQQMVFGNKNEDSLTCVIFSRDCITGKPEIMGEYIVNAQGEDLVSGRKTPISIQKLKDDKPDVYAQIEHIAKTLEQQHNAIQDIEITVEDNQVYVLQKRNAVVSSEAQIAIAKEMNLNLIDHVSIDNVMGSLKVDTLHKADYKGLSANPGVISGIIVKSQADIDKFKHLNKPFVFLSDQALPEHAPIMIATDAFITQSGGATSHAAILARSMNKPCVVGLGKVALAAGSFVTLDAYHGHVWTGEIPIVQTQDASHSLALEILAFKNISTKLLQDKNENTSQFHQLKVNSWLTNLSATSIKKPAYQFEKFLSIAQQTAAIVLKEDHQLRSKKMF